MCSKAVCEKRSIFGNNCAFWPQEVVLYAILFQFRAKSQLGVGLAGTQSRYTMTRDSSDHAGSLQATETELDRAFDVLSHPYRRRILTALAEGNPREEDEFSPEQLQADDEDLRVFTTELFHVHLPKLEAAGYVEWDRETGAITHGPNYDEVAPLVELMRNHPDELPADWP